MSNEKQFSQGFTPNLPLWSFQLQKDSKLALKTRKDLEIHLITRALKDESFRAELIANPKAVIEQEIGSKLSDELEITVLEETEDTIDMVLPCNPYEGLSESELQASLGMTYEDAAQWVFQQQRNSFADELTSIKIAVRAWNDVAFKHDLTTNGRQILIDAVVENIPEGLNIQIKIETCNQIYIAIPKFFFNNLEWQKSEIDQTPGINEINLIIAASGGGPCGFTQCGGSCGVTCICTDTCVCTVCTGTCVCTIFTDCTLTL